MGYDIYFAGDLSDDAPAEVSNTEGYFRSNIWGMGPLREALDKLNLGYWPDGRDIPDPPSEGDFPNEQAFQDAIREWLSAHPSATGSEEAVGIPLHKLSSNDGWLLTSDECTEVVTLYKVLESAGTPSRSLDPEVVERLNEFVRFLDGARWAGGAVVY